MNFIVSFQSSGMYVYVCMYVCMCMYVLMSGSDCLFLHRLAGQAIALKMYLNTTFTSLQLDSMEVWMKVDNNKLIVVM